MSKFSLSKATGSKETKRVAESAASGMPKIPRVNEIVIEAGPKPAATLKRKPVVAPVQVAIYKYTADAGDCWDIFKGDNVPLWQVQIEHGAQRSITFRLREAFEDFLRSAKTSDQALPATVVELEKAAGIRLVIGDHKDICCILHSAYRSLVGSAILVGRIRRTSDSYSGGLASMSQAML